MEQAKHNLVFWFVSECRPRTLVMKAAGPWTHREVVDAIHAKLMGGDSGKRRCRLEFYEFAPPDVGTALPDDHWLQPSHVYYARRLPPMPMTSNSTDEVRGGWGRQGSRGYVRGGYYAPYGPHMPVLKGLHGRV